MNTDGFSARPRGFGRPVDVGELPPPGDGTAMMTLNMANGAGASHRTDANREAQAKLIRRSGASVVALQEVDAGVDRSSNVHTGLDLARRLDPAFEIFSSGKAPEIAIDAQSPSTALRRGADGTTLFQTPRGALVTAESFSGDDRAGGVAGDRGADATYGNALYVAAPNRVTGAYTVVLPHSLRGDRPHGPSDAELSAIGNGPLSTSERAALADKNEAIRRGARSEPRSALVTRIVGPDGREKTVINVHAAAGRDNKELRDRQLAYLAKIVAAERAGPPSRQVVVMGDFNTTVAEVGAALAPVGLHRVVGGQRASIGNLDQVWVSGDVETDTSAQVKTNGTSDHPYAGYTVVR